MFNNVAVAARTGTPVKRFRPRVGVFARRI